MSDITPAKDPMLWPTPPGGLRSRSRRPRHYTVSERKLQANRQLLDRARQRGQILRWRSTPETEAIKQAVWWAFYFEKPAPTEQFLADKLHVNRSYVHRLRRNGPPAGLSSVLMRGKPTDRELDVANIITVQESTTYSGLYHPEVTERSGEDPRRFL